MGCHKLTYRSNFEVLKGSYSKELTLNKSSLQGCRASFYGYQGSEMDDEIKGEGNSYTTHFRQLDPRVGRWLSIDPKTTPWESPYVSMGNNPVLYNDPLGDTLSFKKNLQTTEDIASLAKEDNLQYLVFNDDNTVSLNFGDLNESEVNKILSDDEGLSLINDIVSSDKNILYEAASMGLIRDEFGDNAVSMVYNRAHGILNASDNGKDYADKYSDRPREGYDGQVIIDPTLTVKELDSDKNVITKPRASIIFHELDENYERTHNGVDYNGKKGAHQLAIDRESKFHKKSAMPGQGGAFTTTKPSEEEMKRLYEIGKKYMAE